MDRFPNHSPRSVFEYVLYNPQIAGRGIRMASAASRVFCELPSVSQRNKDDESKLETLHDRAR